jgi:decaprenyl-phosphate phosphoribosyltransferase
MLIMDHIKMLRPHQYLKNLFIFLPLFFGLKITDPDLLLKAFLAFISFSFIASAVYIFNDLNDIKEDRAHPKKKDRPIASGKVSRLSATVTILILLCASILPLLYINHNIISLLLLYIILNISYTIKLRHVAIMDVSIIAIGFVIRIFVGSLATDVPLSMWIVLVTFLLALFLALAKRRDDVLYYLKTGEKTRKSVDGYNMEILNGLMVMMSTATIVSYIMYTISPEVISYFHTNKIYFTVFFVIIGIMRYMQISLLENNSGSPTEVMIKDRFIQLCLAGWILTFAVLIYFNPHF